MKQFGLQIRLTAIGIFILALAMTVFGYAGIKMSSSFIEKRFDDNIRFIAEYLASSSEGAIAVRDVGWLERISSGLFQKDESIKSLIIDDAESKELVYLSRPSKYRLEMIKIPVIIRRNVDVVDLFSNKGLDMLDLRAKDTVPAGSVTIMYTKEEITRLNQSIARYFSIIACILTIIAGIVLYYSTRSVTAPVLEIAKIARKIADGQSDLRAKINSRIPEVDYLSGTFNQMLDSLDQSKKALKDADYRLMRQNILAELGKFSLIIAHEIKNPLSIIKSSVDILKKHIDPNSDKISPTMVQYIQEEISGLNRLIESFLQFARPAAPSMKQKNANGVLNDVIRRFELKIQDNGMEIKNRVNKGLCLVDLDEDLITRMFDNLLNNAFQACRETGEKWVRVETSHTRTQWSAVITDSGPGVLEENISKIFEPFFTTKSKGSGLGLAFVSQVLQAHEGSAEVKNSQKHGAVFSIQLPRTHSQPVEKMDENTGEKAIKGDGING